jgi:CYTH domain-containing protein
VTFAKRFKYAQIERERRFVVDGPSPRIDLGPDFRRIEDRYFGGTSLRLRRVTSPSGEVVERKLNQKLAHEPAIASHRVVTSVYLGEADYDLLARIGGARLVKRRYPWTWGDVAWAVDVFEERLAGLVLVSAEAESEVALAGLPELPMRHVEVTADPLFAGGALAVEDPAAVLRRAEDLLTKANA